MAGAPTAKNIRNTVVSEVLRETIGIVVTTPSIVTMSVVITEAAIQTRGRTKVSLQFKQTYFSGPKYLDGIVCHTKTGTFSSHEGQAKTFFQR